ncbi:hypothetical protein [Burkholderia cepacia]|uniref:hypothetical protein n=1 Tax=Burkholderia cepacia TaxID=292 RepID=UPI000AC49700|nr:hypothetical protein [Burkholderia cepacia]
MAIHFNKSPDDNQFVLRSKEMDLAAGWLGKCFGTGTNAPLNIAGFVISLLVIAGLVVLFVPSAIPAADFWKISVPLITLVMGFIFGKGTNGG